MYGGTSFVRSTHVSQKPGNLRMSKANKKVLAEFYSNKHVRRVIRWGNGTSL